MRKCGLSTYTGGTGKGKSARAVRCRTYAEHEDRIRTDRTTPVCVVERGGMSMDEKEIFEICQSVDSFIAKELTESIVCGTSYDMLEAHHGVLPISKSHFYRKKGTAKMLMRQRMAHLVEEKNGQYMIVWGREE